MHDFQRLIGVTVHCRTGSLERMFAALGVLCTVHCRTGSLEIVLKQNQSVVFVHCRTGSLENIKHFIAPIFEVHCRTGSLEISTKKTVRPRPDGIFGAKFHFN